MCGRRRVSADQRLGVSDMDDDLRQENEELKKRLTELTAEAANN
jgi:hypothetical protein